MSLAFVPGNNGGFFSIATGREPLDPNRIAERVEALANAAYRERDATFDDWFFNEWAPANPRQVLALVVGVQTDPDNAKAIARLIWRDWMEHARQQEWVREDAIKQLRGRG